MYEQQQTSPLTLLIFMYQCDSQQVVNLVITQSGHNNQLLHLAGNTQLKKT